ncbi:MAG: acyl-CoA thioesterase [Bacillota bacterium]
MGKLEYINDIVRWEEEFTFFYPLKVRFSETDMFGHLNNTVPFIYFEQARIDYLKSKGLMQSWLHADSENIPVVADLQCDFLKQVFFDEELKVFVKADDVGNSSVDLHYMVKNGKGEICLTGRSTIVQISKKTGKSVPWTGETKNLFQVDREVVHK